MPLLNGTGPLTLFAPLDDAFEKPEEFLNRRAVGKGRSKRSTRVGRVGLVWLKLLCLCPGAVKAVEEGPLEGLPLSQTTPIQTTNWREAEKSLTSFQRLKPSPSN